MKNLILFHLFLTQPSTASEGSKNDFPWKEFGYLNYRQLGWRLEGCSASSIRGAVAWHLRNGSVSQVQRNGKTFIKLTSLGKEMLSIKFPCLSASEKWDGHWRLVVFTGDSKQVVTHAAYRMLRKILQEAGFRPLERAVYLSPYAVPDATRTALTKLRLLPMITAFETRSFLLGDEQLFMNQVWNLEKKTKEYTNIIKEYERLLTILRTSLSLTSSQKISCLRIVSSHLSLISDEVTVPDQFYPEGNPWKESLFVLRRLFASLPA